MEEVNPSLTQAVVVVEDKLLAVPTNELGVGKLF
jgi:hypothetical protein